MRRGFTLLEFLVVLGTLALLAGIAIPSLRVALARSESAQCVSHLRSLGTALNLYLADHQMTMPDMEAGRTSTSEEVPVLDNTLDSYVENKAVFTCPAGRALAAASGTSYFFNSTLRNQNVTHLTFLWVDQSSRIPIFVDKEGWHRFVENRVNHLFADGHVANELRLVAE